MAVTVVEVHGEARLISGISLKSILAFDSAQNSEDEADDAFFDYFDEDLADLDDDEDDDEDDDDDDEDDLNFDYDDDSINLNLARSQRKTQSVIDRSRALGQACLRVIELLESGDPIRLTESDAYKRLDFNVRILDFGPTTAQAISPDIDLELEGSVWLLKVEATNLGKLPVDPDDFRTLMALVDQDDCVFTRFEGFDYPDSGITHERNRDIARFGAFYAPRQLLPKITVRGTVPFLLPFIPAEYRLTTRKAAGL